MGGVRYDEIDMLAESSLLDWLSTKSLPCGGTPVGGWQNTFGRNLPDGCSGMSSTPTRDRPGVLLQPMPVLNIPLSSSKHGSGSTMCRSVSSGHHIL